MSANLKDVSASAEEIQNDDNELLTADEIFSADDIKTVDVEVPEWGKPGKPGIVRLKQFSNSELLKYGEHIEGNGQKQANLALVVKSAIKKDGTPLFTDADLRKLQGKSAKAINTLAKAALELNGVGEGAVKRAKND